MISRLLTSAFLLLISSIADARTVTISSGEFPPWTGSNLPNQGYVNHIISEAFASVGVKVEFVYLPWKRAFEEARRGEYDLTSYWYANSERLEAMLVSDPVVQNRTVFFQRAEEEQIAWQTLKDLENYRLSATIGFTYTEAFLEAIANRDLKVTMVPTDTQNIKMLMSRRVDLIATDEMSGYYMAATLSVDPRKLRVLEPELAKVNGHVMATKNNPASSELIELFNRGLQQIKANGKYQKIITRVDETSFYDPGVNE
jgi:polar amino acid transport system substrate-binding protein